MEKINTSILDDFIERVILTDLAKKMILKWSFKEKLAVCGIISTLSPEDSETRIIGDAALKVAKFLLGVDLEYIDRRLNKLLELKKEH